jgi:glycosidase
MRYRSSNSQLANLLLAALLLAGCSLDTRSAKDQCHGPQDCLSGFACIQGLCRTAEKDAGIDAVTPDLGNVDESSWRDAVIYHVMIDRFKNGDPKNDRPTQTDWAVDFQGGDLQGLLDKLEQGFFSNLGVNVLWISSPIDTVDKTHVANDGHAYSGYHGFWPRDRTKVDARFGTVALLEKLVEQAHVRGIRVVMDYMVNHVHEKSPDYLAHADEWFHSLTFDSKQCICGKGCQWEGPEGLRCWFASYLPDFDHSKKNVRQEVIKNAIWWIEQTGIDGLRLDAAAHVETALITEMRAAIEATFPKRDILLIGSMFTGDPVKIRELLGSDKLHGQLDFPLRQHLLETVLMRKTSMKNLHNYLDTTTSLYGPNAIMQTVVGVMELPRVIHYAEDTPLFEVWDSGAARIWENQPQQPATAAPYERLQVAYTALLTLPGTPVIYYGDEVGMAGAGDPDNRRFRQWAGFNTHQRSLEQHIAKLLAIRAENSALRRGTRALLHLSNDVYAYEMRHATNRVVVVLNRSDSAQVINLSGTFTNLLDNAAIDGASLTIPARSSMVLR